jgi:ABC-type amino acid transport substrate-binding protein
MGLSLKQLSPLVALALGAAQMALTAPAVQAAPVTIRSAMQDSNTYKFDPKNEKQPGICIEIIRAVEKADPEIKFSGMDAFTPLPRIVAELASGGSLDAFCGLLKTPERAAQVNFLDIPIYSLRHKVAVRAEDTVSVKTFDDIRKLGTNNTIAATQGLVYAAYLQQQGGLTIDDGSKDPSANFKKLLSERVRFYYNAESTLVEYIHNEKLQGKVKILPSVFKEENQYFVTSKTLPAATADKLRAALDKLAKQGELAKIFARYSSN